MPTFIALDALTRVANLQSAVQKKENAKGDL
jgi:hypothetical protein